MGLPAWHDDDGGEYSTSGHLWWQGEAMRAMPSGTNGQSPGVTADGQIPVPSAPQRGRHVMFTPEGGIVSFAGEW